MINKKRIVGAITGGAIMASLVLPVGTFAATNVTISGNAAKTTNVVNVKNVQKSNTSQLNAAGVINLTGALQNTGKNKSSHNNGGNVSVTSGNASSTVTNNTTIGGSVVNGNSCICSPSNNTVDVVGNGEKSTNVVNVTNKNVSNVSQANYSLVVNGTLVAQNTGGNSASHNNGGTVDVTSGDATSSVTNTTTIGGNVVNP